MVSLHQRPDTILEKIILLAHQNVLHNKIKTLTCIRLQNKQIEFFINKNFFRTIEMVI